MKNSLVQRALVISAFASLLAACHLPTPFSDPPPEDNPDFGDNFFPPTGPQPQFGTTVTQPTAPPPISGGTLTVLADGKTAVASDPDRDQIYVVDLAAKTLRAAFALSAGDEPGRVVEDGNGRVHVVLRTGGAIVTIAEDTWTLTSRRPVCAAPRGIAWDKTGDQLHVACAGGELVSLPAAGGDATRTLHLDRDLRDVLVQNGRLLVSRFHTAELLTIDADGHLVHRDSPHGTFPSFGQHAGDEFAPAAAWRLAVAPSDNQVYMLHQRGLNGIVSTSQPGGYGGGGDSPCGGGSIVNTGMTPITPGMNIPSTPDIPNAVLPVDFAFAKKSDEVAVVAAGNAHTPGVPTVLRLSRSATDGQQGDCIFPNSGDTSIPGEPVAVAYAANDLLIVQSREPAFLYIADTGEKIALSADSKADTGHAVFHSNAGAGLACASCHLEGGEDGRVWTFENSGPRRTQSIRGGIMGTEPFHWDGDQQDFPTLMGEVFKHRMGGPTLSSDQMVVTQAWINKIPLVPNTPPSNVAAVDRGRALFQDSANVGCISCHSGTHETDNKTVDVGTGGLFQVPSLRGVVWRAPYLHDGRAPTLADRFTSVGGGDQHGVTSQLNQDQINDLIAFLETL